MKKYRSLFLTLAAVSTVACQSGNTEINEAIKSAEATGDFIISASFEAQTSTRTTLSEDSEVLWTEGDSFALLTPSSRDKFTLVSGDNSGSAEFAGNITGDAPYYALYPFSEHCIIENDSLKFSLPQVQIISSQKSFAQNASPALATIGDPSAPAQFRNLCGVLKLTLYGVTMSVSSLEIIDNSGKCLWGECTVALDGKQGTDEQSMTVTGGSGSIKLKMSKAVNLYTSKTTSFYVVVPAGSFTKGFSIKVYDNEGSIKALASTSGSKIQLDRSMITSMNKYKLTDGFSEPADTLARGYYKEVFMDGGSYLTHRTTLPAVTGLLGWSMEYISSSKKAVLTDVIQGDDIDPNGALLYPDSEPRFRMIYVNGGSSIEHGEALGSKGRSQISTFVKKGGGYVGTCAGAILACKGVDNQSTTSELINIWSGHVYHTGMSDTETDLTVVSGCPLLKYYDFGGDKLIKSVHHNGGVYMSQSDYTPPSSTEILLKYKNANSKSEGKVACWAYKPGKIGGRRVLIGSHPEGVSSGERRDLMAAMCRYATDGNGFAQSKATLEKGEVRNMSKSSAEYAPIGDGQYHFFTVNIPENARNIKLDLQSSYTGNLCLALRKAGSAWLSDADYFLAQEGSSKSFCFDSLPAGDWSISVFCPDKPTASVSDGRYNYSGNIEPVKGVKYTISVDWE